MQKKQRNICNDLHELLSLTDEAVAHAEKNNIGNVNRCMRKRRFIFEQWHSLKTLIPYRDDAIVCMKEVLHKDKHLKELLEGYKSQCETEKEKIRLQRSTLSRYTQKRYTRPRFIDKKA